MSLIRKKDSLSLYLLQQIAIFLLLKQPIKIMQRSSLMLPEASNTAGKAEIEKNRIYSTVVRPIREKLIEKGEACITSHSQSQLLKYYGQSWQKDLVSSDDPITTKLASLFKKAISWLIQLPRNSSTEFNKRGMSSNDEPSNPTTKLILSITQMSYTESGSQETPAVQAGKESQVYFLLQLHRSGTNPNPSASDSKSSLMNPGKP
jgi:hypothetical protein